MRLCRFRIGIVLCLLCLSLLNIPIVLSQETGETVRILPDGNILTTSGLPVA